MGMRTTTNEGKCVLRLVSIRPYNSLAYNSVAIRIGVD